MLKMDFFLCYFRLFRHQRCRFRLRGRRAGGGGWMKAVSLLIILTFIFPYLTWAFEPKAYNPSDRSLPDIEIPADAGTVIASAPGSEARVIYLQDLHCHAEVQRNLERIITALAAKHRLKFVAVEGAANPIDISKLAEFPDKEIIRTVGDYFLQAGRVTGPELAAVLRRDAVRLVGIEDSVLYEKSLAAVGEFLTDESQGCILDLREALDEVKARVYNPQLRELDGKRRAEREGRLPLEQYAGYLCDRLKRNGAAPQHAYAGLQRCAAGRAVFFAPSADIDDVYREAEAAERELGLAWAENPDQAELRELDSRLDIMEKMVNISAGAEEVEQYRARPEAFQARVFAEYLRRHQADEVAAAEADFAKLDGYLRSAQRFYDLADQRSDAFVRSLRRHFSEQGDGVGVLVAGGFHAERMLAGLKAAGWSYMCVKPRVTQAEPDNPYFQLLLNRRTPLEKALAARGAVIARRSYFPEASARSDRSEAGLPRYTRTFFAWMDYALALAVLAVHLPAAAGAEDLRQRFDAVMNAYRFRNDRIAPAWDRVRLRAKAAVVPFTLGVTAVLHRSGRLRLKDRLADMRFGEYTVETTGAPVSERQYAALLRPNAGLAALVHLPNLAQATWANGLAATGIRLQAAPVLLKQATRATLEFWRGTVAEEESSWAARLGGAAAWLAQALPFAVDWSTGAAWRHWLRAARISAGGWRDAVAEQRFFLMGGLFALAVQTVFGAQHLGGPFASLAGLLAGLAGLQLMAAPFLRLHARTAAWAPRLFGMSPQNYRRYLNRRFWLFGLVTLGLACLVPGPLGFLAGQAGGMLSHWLHNAVARVPASSKAEIPREQREANARALEALGLSYAEFQQLTRCQEKYERELLASNPALAEFISSLRTQERFSQTVLDLTVRFRNQGAERPLAQALLFALDQYYGDLAGDAFRSDEVKRIEESQLLQQLQWLIQKNVKPTRVLASGATARAAFDPFLTPEDRPDPKLWSRAAGVEIGGNPLREVVGRALATSHPVLFREERFADRTLMAALSGEAKRKNIRLSVLWSHPFTEERQMVGHAVPREGEDRLVFGLGELTRVIRAAEREAQAAGREGRAPQKSVLLIKNIEAMDPEVRTQLQELLRVRELSHPELGTLVLPPHLQILFTQQDGAHLEDESFYDRVLVKKIPAAWSAAAPAAMTLPAEVTERNYPEFIRLEKISGGIALALPGKIRIPLAADRFRDLAPETRGTDLVEEIYARTGLILDFDTVRMLAAMQRARDEGRTVLRIEGPTGVGKTFTAEGYARLRGSAFLTHPASEGMELADLIGGFEQSEDGYFRFNGDTPFKRRLEQGGVVALSELNALLDGREKVALAWWLTQIAAAEPAADGCKRIRLTEVPAAEGRDVPEIRIHPDTLIVVDTNPEGDYAARGSFPDIFNEYAPVVRVPAFVSGAAERRELEQAKLRRYAETYLRHAWVIPGRKPVGALRDAKLRSEAAGRLAEIYWRTAGGQARGEFGQGSHTVLSARELRRLAEDVLKHIEDGLSLESALAAAARDHLIACWPEERDRQAVVKALRKDCFPAKSKEALARLTAPAGFGDFIADQALTKNRPVHVRISPETDLRREFRGFQTEHPETELRIIPITSETDRFMLEGGLIPRNNGRALTFGKGILGRLADEAAAHPDRQVVYVFENAHNLRAEEAVALNELLQTRRFIPRGRSEEVVLPDNAHLLLVSRAPLNWSPAEQSRYTVLGYQPEARRLQRAAEAAVERGLRGRQAPTEVAEHAVQQILDAYRRYQRDLTQSAAYGVRASHRRFDAYLRAVERELGRVPAGGMNAAGLYSVLANVFSDVFLSGYGAAAQREKSGRFWKHLDLFRRADRWRETESGADSRSADPLVKAKVAYLEAAGSAAKTAALKAVADAFRSAGEGARWVRQAQGDAQPLQLIRGWVRSPQAELKNIRDMVYTEDGGECFTIEKETVRRYEIADGKPVFRETLTENKDKVQSLSAAPDGSFIAAVRYNGEAIILRRINGRYVRTTLGHSVPLTSVRLTAGGSVLIAIEQNGEAAQIYRWKNGRFAPEEKLAHARGWIEACDATPDGSVLATCGGRGVIQVYALEDGKYVRRHALSDPNGTLRAVSLTRDGAALAAGGQFGLAWVYRLEHGRYQPDPAEARPKIGCSIEHLALSGDGSQLAIAGKDDTIRILRHQEGKYLPWLEEACRRYVCALSFRRDGALVAALELGAAQIFRRDSFLIADRDTAVSLTTQRVFPRTDISTRVEILDETSSAGAPEERLAQARVEFADARRARDVRKAEDALRRVRTVLSQFGGRLDWKRRTAGTLMEFDFGRGLRKEDLNGPAEINRLAFSGDDRTLVTVEQGAVRINRLKNGKYERVATLPDSSVVRDYQSLVLSEDATLLAVSVNNKRIRLFRLEGGAYVDDGVLTTPDWVGSLQMTADGSKLAVTGINGMVRVYTRRGTEFILHQELGADAGKMKNAGGRTIGGSNRSVRGWVQKAALTPDGSVLAAVGSEGRVRIYILKNGRYEADADLRVSGFADAAALTPDGAALAVGCTDGSVHVFRREQGRYVRKQALDDAADAVTGLAWSADGSALAAGDRKGKVRIYAADGERCERVFEDDYGDSVREITVKGDGRTFVAHGDFAFQPPRVYRPAAFLVENADTAVDVDTLKSFPRGKLSQKVQVVREPDSGSSPEERLAQARVEFADARRERNPGRAQAALERMKSLVNEFGRRLAWKRSTAETLKEFEIGRGLRKQDLNGPPEAERLRFSADDRTLVTIERGAVRVNRLENGKYQSAGTLTEPGMTQDYQSLALSADAGVLAMALKNDRVRLYLQKGGNYAEACVLTTPDRVKSLHLTADGSGLMVVGEQGVVRRYAREKGEFAFRQRLGFDHEDTGITAERDKTDAGRPLTGYIIAADLTPDGSRLAAAGRHGMVRVYSKRSGGYEIDHTLRVPGIVKTVSLTPDGSGLAAGAEDGSVHIFRLEHGRYVKKLVLKDAEVEITALALNPDCSRLAAGDINGNVRIYRLSGDDSELILEDHYGPAIRDLVFKSDGRTLAATGNYFSKPPRLYRETAILAENAESAVDLETLESFSRGDLAPAVRVADESGISGTPQEKLDRARVNFMDARRKGDAKKAETALARLEALLRSPAHWRWERASSAALDGLQLGLGWLRRPLPGRVEGQFVQTAFSADDRRFFGLENGNLIICPAEDGRYFRRQTIVLPGKWIDAFTVTPDGTRLAVTADDGTIHIYRLGPDGDYQAGQTLPGGEARLASLAFTADGAVLATAGKDGLGRIYRESAAGAYSEKPQILDDAGKSLRTLALTPDGSALVLAGDDNHCRVYRPRAGKYELEDTLSGFSKAEHPGADLSADGSTLVLAGYDNCTRIYRLEKGKFVRRHKLNVAVSAGRAVRLAPDGAWLALGGHPSEEKQNYTGLYSNHLFLYNLENGECSLLRDDEFERTTLDALALKAGGSALVCAGNWAPLREYRWAPFIVEDAETVAALDTRDSFPRGQLPPVVLRPTAAETALAPLERLARTVVGFIGAETDRDPLRAQTALLRLREIVNRFGAQLPWREVADRALRDLEIGRGWRRRILGKSLGGERMTAFSADGRVLAKVEGAIHLQVSRWRDGEYQAGPRLSEFGMILSLAMTPDGTGLYVMGDKGLFVLRLRPDGEYETVQCLPKTERRLLHTAVSADGALLVTAGDEGKVRIYRREKDGGKYKEQPQILGDFGGRVLSVSLTADGSTLAVAGEDSQVRVYRRSQDGGFSEAPQILDDARQTVGNLSLTPDGAWLAAAENGDTLRLYRRRRGKYELERTLTCELGKIRSLCLLPDASAVAVVGSGNENLVYRLDDGASDLIVNDKPISGSRTVVLRNASGSRTGDLRSGVHSFVFCGLDLQEYFADTFFILNQDRAVALDTQQEFSVQDLIGRIETVNTGETARTDAAAPVFTPRYGKLPFYFLADRDGAVSINYAGRVYPTRHRLLAPDEWRRAHPDLAAGVLRPVELEQVRHPYAEEAASLGAEDFLMATAALQKAEGLALKTLAGGWHVDLEGEPGGGKTSMAREIALLLGLPRFVFQMHGERELSDWLGGYREDNAGNFVLTTGQKVTGPDGRTHFRLPLLELLTTGGVFVVDEGAIGDRGRQLLNWLSPLLQGDKKLFIEEFPGHPMEVTVHPDFHLIITNNLPEKTQARRVMGNEVSGHMQFIHVPEDDAAETLERLFKHALGPEGDGMAEGLGTVLAQVHHALKAKIGKELGKDRKERYYISKREILRVAEHVRRYQREHPGENGCFALYRAMRIMYEAMFSHPEERRLVHELIKQTLAKNAAVGEARVRALEKRLDSEVRGLYGGASTPQEAWVAYITDELFSQDANVLFISEAGARTADMLKYATRRHGAEMVRIDAAPEHSELEILGGHLPVFGEAAEAGERQRLRFVRGAITRHLLDAGQMRALKSASGTTREIVVWLRNLDQWSETVRTALNGLLENNFIDLETEEGKIQRFYKPPHVHFAAEMADESDETISSAAYNRYVEIGVSGETPGRTGGGTETGDFERTLLNAYELDPPEAEILAYVFKGVRTLDENRRWAQRRQYRAGPDVFYAAAESLQLAKQTDPRWRRLLEQIARGGYDPRRYSGPHRPSRTEERALLTEYRKLAAETIGRELEFTLGARFTEERAQTGISDRERYREIVAIALRAVFDGAEAPEADTAVRCRKDGVVESIGGIPLKPTYDAKPPSRVQPQNRVLYTAEARKGLCVLARAARLSRVAAFVGEPGSLKTTLTAHFAEITGRKYYKYQTHAGSEAKDLTIDIEQDEAGRFHKRIKELYRHLREGNVVIDVDEANIAPQILWALEPVIRGETMIHPIFPEEEPFAIGPEVVVALTYNPTHMSGRHDINRRQSERMLIAHMSQPDASERAAIIEGFYGVRTPQAEAEVGAEAETGPEGPADRPRAGEEGETAAAQGGQEDEIAHEGAVDVQERYGADREMKEGYDTFGREETAPDELLPQAYGVFSPELYPYTRYAAYDRFDERAGDWVMPAEPSEILAVPVLSEAQLQNRRRDYRKTHDCFTGTYALDLSDGKWHTLPSAGAEMELLSLKALNAAGMALEAGRDSADNYYVRAAGPVAPGRVTLRYEAAVPAGYFGFRIGPNIRFDYPDRIPAEVREAMEAIGLTGREADFREVLFRLVEYFRDFRLETDGIKSGQGSLYLDLIHSKCGVCRHRAFAFARTALGIGLEARLVVTDTHAFSEVKVPGLGWQRFDLGGGGDPLRRDLRPLSHERHVPRDDAGLPEPENYRRDEQAMNERMAKAMEQQGIEPQVSPRAGQGEPAEADGQTERAEGEAGDAEGEGGEGGGANAAAARDRQVDESLDALDEELVADMELNDEVSALFLKGKGDTEFIFQRMLRAVQSGERWFIRKQRSGMAEIDPVAWATRQPKIFKQKIKVPKYKTTATAALLDFSGSMEDIKQELAFITAAVGRNFWRIGQAAPKHFHYDLSWFTRENNTVVGLEEQISSEENDLRLLRAANQAGEGGTDLMSAMKAKLKDFENARAGRSAQIKYLTVFTDGADYTCIRKGRFTPEFREVMDGYRAAGIDVIAIGVGPGAEDVTAFDEDANQHYVRIREGQWSDIAETIAKVAEQKLLGSGLLPQGDITNFLQIGPAEEKAEEANREGHAFTARLGYRSALLAGLSALALGGAYFSAGLADPALLLPASVLGLLCGGYVLVMGALRFLRLARAVEAAMTESLLQDYWETLHGQAGEEPGYDDFRADSKAFARWKRSIPRDDLRSLRVQARREAIAWSYPEITAALPESRRRTLERAMDILERGHPWAARQVRAHESFQNDLDGMLGLMPAIRIAGAVMGAACLGMGFYLLAASGAVLLPAILAAAGVVLAALTLQMRSPRSVFQAFADVSTGLRHAAGQARIRLREITERFTEKKQPRRIMPQRRFDSAA